MVRVGRGVCGVCGVCGVSRSYGNTGRILGFRGTEREEGKLAYLSGPRERRETTRKVVG